MKYKYILIDDKSNSIYRCSGFKTFKEAMSNIEKIKKNQMTWFYPTKIRIIEQDDYGNYNVLYTSDFILKGK